eukprot:4975769-Pyramimonas_sp.AAC.4
MEDVGKHTHEPTLASRSQYGMKVPTIEGNSKHRLDVAGSNKICRKYCKTHRPCHAEDDGPLGSTGKSGVKGRCLHAPEQPWWLPWPYGMAMHL